MTPYNGSITLTVKAEKGVRSGISLVGRSGPATSGIVTEVTDYMAKGGKAKVTLPDAQQYDRITAVIANADGRVKGDSRRYKYDDVKYSAALR